MFAMETIFKESLMRTAMDEAQNAVSEWNSPFWVVIADLKWNIVMTDHNTSYTEKDPTAHAEINAIRKLCKQLGTRDLKEYCLISNAESCPMCMTAAIKTNIQYFIFGASIESDSNPYITVQDIAKYSKNPLYIETGVLKEECEKQISDARKK